jgi:hypothetical protein
MAATQSGRNVQSPPKPGKDVGIKRTADTNDAPTAKRGKIEKDQKTIEQTMNGIEHTKDDTEVADPIDEKPKPQEDHQENGEVDLEAGGKEINGNAHNDESSGSGAHSKSTSSGVKSAFDEVESDAGEVKEAAKHEEAEKDKDIATNSASIVEDPEREKSMPSSILEKGVIYFFFRGRVGVEDPQGIEDVARSYIVLRPLPIGAKLGEGPLEDSGNARLLALPKKMLPKSKTDRFLMFVDKAKSTVKDLKENFVSGNEYATKSG